MAQGGVEYKRRLASYENADKLIEMVVSVSLLSSVHVFVSHIPSTILFDLKCASILEIIHRLNLSTSSLTLLFPFRSLSLLSLYAYTNNDISHLSPPSQLNARGEGLPLTCVMAVFHIFNFVASKSPPSSDSSHPSPSKGVASSSTLSGARFVARAVDKGNFLRSICDVLRDGPPKLQMAHLSVFNLLLCDERYSQGREVGGGERGAASALQHVRKTLLGTKGLVQSVIRLAEHGASSGIRAKALIALQVRYVILSIFLFLSLSYTQTHTHTHTHTAL